MNEDIIKKKQIEKLISKKRLSKKIGFSYAEIIDPQDQEEVVIERLSNYFYVSPHIFKTDDKIKPLTLISNYLIGAIAIISIFLSIFSTRLAIVSKLPLLFLILNSLFLLLSLASSFVFRKNLLAKTFYLVIPMLCISIFYLVYYWSRIIA